MRETVNSMRAYMILAGVLSAFSTLSAFSAVHDVIFGLLVLVALGMSVAFVVAGIALRSWLKNHLSWVTGIIWGEIALAVLIAAYAITVFHAAPASVAWQPLITIAIGLYLMRNAKRLAAELTKQP
jgi:hypothetical protein